MSQSIKSEIVIKCAPGEVYFALTRSLRIEQWLCDYATLQPRPGGRMYLWWNGDFYSSGEYIGLEHDRLVKFKWHARFEPAASEVVVELVPVEKGTRVTLTHIVPDGADWEQRAAGFKAEWDRSLPNLASLLETGLDRRIYDRPMVGIQISDFNAEIARTSGIPVSEGLRLAETVEGMGARAAGLQKDDVIVEFNGKAITNDLGTLPLALQGKKGGDRVEVVFYRGPEKHKVTMELSRRPIPVIPPSAQELASLVRKNYDNGLTELENSFLGVTDSEADHIPVPGEWSAKQTLAHLIHTERNWGGNIDDLVGGYNRQADDFGGNILAHVNATVTAYGSIREMLAEMKRLAIENVTYLAHLPDEFISRKSDYLNLGNNALNGMLPHMRSHIDQIERAIKSSRK